MEKNECGGCTLCCKLFDIPDLHKPAYTKCEHCIENVGCNIYNNRPRCCRGFNCAWLQNVGAPIELRPDKCKIIFEKISDDVFFGTQDADFPMTQMGKNQIIAFNNQGYSVVLSVKGIHQLYLIDGHNKEYIKETIDKFLEGRDGIR